MKRLLFIPVLLLCAVPARATFTVTDTCNGTTSCSLAGSHKPGDLLIWWAYRAGSATAPTKPAALTNVTNGSSATGASRSWRMACSVAGTTASIASGTFTNATNMGAIAVSGTGDTSTANCATDGVIQVGTANSVSSATATYSALTLGSSSNIAILVMGSSTSGQTCMPASGTSKTSTGDINIGIANATGNWASGTCTITSSVTTEIVVEVKAAATALAGCTGSPCPTLVQDVSWGTNDGGLIGSVFKFHLPHPTLANNLLICGASWDTTTVTLTLTDNNGGNTWVAGPTSNDGTRMVALRYVLGVAAGTQDLTFTLSTAEFDVHFRCSEFYNVATSSAVDGTATSTSNITGPLVQSGSITTTTNNDLIYSYVIDDANLSATQPVTSWQPGNSFNLLTAERRIGHAGQYIVWGSNGAINPSALAYQVTNDTFGIAAIAFKAASAGTAPTGMRIVHEYTTTPGTTSYVVQFPCSGNLFVATGSTAPAQADITSITDTDSNTWVRKSSTGNPQMFYAQGPATCTNPNTRTITVAISSVGVPDPIVFYDISGASASAFDTTMGVVTTSGNQTDYATSSTVCSNNANSNTTLSATPSTANGIIFVVENTGAGPECGMSGSGNIFDSGWFQTEDDACCGTLNSSCGYGHIVYSSATSQTVTFNWSNSQAGTGGPGSGFAIAMAAFASAAAPSGPPANQFPRIVGLGRGQE